MSSTTTELDRLAVVIPRDAARSISGFRQWARSDDFPQTGRISYIGGDVYVDLGPEELSSHNLIKMAVARDLGAFVRRLNLGHVYGSGALVSHDDAETSHEPDATFVSWESFHTGRVRMVPVKGEADGYKELEGSPDLTVEVVSATSAVKDTQELRAKYHRAGVREYWLIDPRGGELRFDVLVPGEHGYQPQPADERGFRRSALLDRAVRLTRTPDPIGTWQYMLDIEDPTDLSDSG